ncbi:MarR family winged helix-turn-helix transcriptional regulator [Pseudonocardia sp. GCM10023141]|uniref:MarR family winged helix-turn-helix transcriptional regulator n=1 Tax=Pseudonocardia sp. GCM10023141 TaxID=3252653 RepID=UPI00361DF664
MTDGAAARAWLGMRTLVFERYDRRHQVCAALGMSFIKVKALRRVAHAPLTMRELTEQLATDKPYTTLVVDDLERRGLVVRSVHPDDRRSKIVTVTPAGAVEAARADAILEAPPAALSALPAADLAALDRIIAVLAAGSAAPPDGGEAEVDDHEHAQHDGRGGVTGGR